jgi:hypothetical protein
MWRIERFVYSRLIDGGDVVSLTGQPRFTPQKHCLIYVSVRGRVNPKAHSGVGRIRQIEGILSAHRESNPRPTLPRAPCLHNISKGFLRNIAH